MKKLRLMVNIALCLLSCTTNASVVTYGCSNPSSYIDSCTLQELFNGGYFEVDGLRFSNWQLVSSSYTTAAAPDPSSMIVQVLDSETLNDWAGPRGDGPGFRFLDPEEIYGDQYRIFTYSYEVTVLGNNQLITSNALILEGYQGTGVADGYLEVNEVVFDSQGSELGSKNIFIDPPFTDNYPVKELDIVEFQPQALVAIETELSESGSNMNDESYVLGLQEYYQRFGYTIVPIAPAIYLFSSGLLGLIGISRIRKPT